MKSAENGISQTLLLRNGITTVPATTGDLFYPQKTTLLLWLNIELGIIMGKKILCFVLGYYRQKTESGLFQKKYSFFWRAGGEQYEGRVFFKWDKMDKILKEKGKTKNDIRFHINKNNEIEVFLNDEPLEVESTRVYKSNLDFEI